MPTTNEMPWLHIAGRDGQPEPGDVPNVATQEGYELGHDLARLADAEYQRTGRDARCDTCAFRGGEHLANGSVPTLMSAVKCIAERTPFWCHESDRPCGGWVAAVASKEQP